MDALGQLLDSLACPRCGGRFERTSAGVRCAAGHEGTWRDGYLDLLDAPERLSLGQRVFVTRAGALTYERLREGPAVGLITGQRFSDEVTWLLDALWRAGSPQLTLDAPCGQGNFTAAVAARSRGAVIGVDLSGRMLELAARRLHAARLSNVLLVRADALALPLRSGVVDAVSSCGGLHLYPDAARAIGEMRRVLRDDGACAGLTFRSTAMLRPIEQAIVRAMGVRAFDFDALGGLFREAGFVDWSWHGERFVGWFSARAPASARSVASAARA